ncbi:hypothetical protein BDW02DRAFT_566960 [Decorospora gaudefroyi]|uniref:BTB domain-containing protein n=1 Tax=Decorospora gaudefroyi TaxID=184978 RepID=A0A6A5KSB7_9PLEO|nr:hypothetical protein BDW02DRAFT_566960 [Decorospora gaudefroyi]
MDHSKTATPPTTPSPTPMAAADTTEPTSPMTDLSPNTDSSDFKPLQMLMQTTITIECGPDLQSKLTVHEGCLRCHSKPLDQRYAKAKAMREQQEESKALCKKLAAYVFPELNAREFENNGSEEEVIPLIVSAHEVYPISVYQSGIKKVVDGAVDEQLTQKTNIKPSLPVAPSRKTTPKDITRDMKLQARLALLKPRCVQSVAEQLFIRLHQINKKERSLAKEDPVRAAAQQRLLLPGVAETTVRSLIQWIYQGTLLQEDTEQLYAIMQLAEKLGVEALNEICLTKLYNATSNSLQITSANGIPLRTLLGYSQGPTDDVIAVVFKHAIKDETTPKRLLDLVVNTLTANLDMELWLDLKVHVTPDLALQIIEAMIAGEQVKKELYDQASIKSENEGTITEQPFHVG